MNLTENITVDSLALNGSTLSGAYTLTSSYGGLNLAGANSLSVGTTLKAEGPFAFANSSATLANAGTLQFGSNGSIGQLPASSAVLTNHSTGLIRFAPLNGTSVGDSSASPFSLVNHGTVLADNASSNSLYAPITNTGLIHVTAGSALALGGTFLQTDGEVRISGGSLSAASGQTLVFEGGMLRASGSLSAPLSLTDTALEIGAAQNAANLSVFGDVTLLSGASVSFDLDGTVQGEGYDHLGINGSITLGGTLDLRISTTFASSILPGDEFVVLSASSIGGSFANVSSGQRLALPDGVGSVVVTITGTEIKLGDFSAIPEPSAWSAFAGLAALGFGLRRRRPRA